MIVYGILLGWMNLLDSSGWMNEEGRLGNSNLVYVKNFIRMIEDKPVDIKEVTKVKSENQELFEQRRNGNGSSMTRWLGIGWN